MDVPQTLKLGDRRGRVTDAVDDVAALIDARIDDAYRLATVILGSALDAEDAVADAALDAWRSRTKLRNAERFDAWFGRILVNACRDRLRSRRRHPVVSLEYPELMARAADGDFPDRVDAREAMSRALTVLPPDELIVVALRYWSDLTVDAIASRVDVPAGTVKSRLNRALNRLRVAMTNPEDGP